MAGRQLSLLPILAPVYVHPAPVDCPVCGRPNPFEHTFRCRRCDRSYLCRRHLDAEARMCAECAAEDAAIRRRVEEERARRAQPHPIYSRWPFDAAEAKRRQEATAAALRIPAERDLDLGEGVVLRVVLIPAGQFDMGSPPLGRDRLPCEKIHRVQITRPFYIGKYPVTQDEWQAVMGANPSRFHGARLPVEQVSWHDCRRFAEKARARGGSALALPTEAQWEYACRAGAKTRFCFADADANLDEHAWYNANSADTIHPVGEKQPNAWGLHDLHGNVWEWCSDWYELSYYDSSPERDPEGPTAGGERVARGGSWRDHPSRTRCADRLGLVPSHKDACLGFRLVSRVEF